MISHLLRIWRSGRNRFSKITGLLSPYISGSPVGPGLFFGEVEQYQSKNRTITIENRGSIELIITGVAVTGSDSTEFRVDRSGMSSVVEVGGKTSFNVIFNPNVKSTEQIRPLPYFFMSDYSCL